MIDTMKYAINSEDELSEIIRSDPWMMEVLIAAQSINLPDWWIGAGFLRNKVWDTIEGRVSKPTRDVDLVYFSDIDKSPETDWAYDTHMKGNYPFAEWEVRNQARMHYVNNSQPFISTADGISNWVETATCVAVRLKNDSLEYLFCYGTDDLFNLIARPIPDFQTEERMETFYNRIKNKQWQEKWPHLQIVTESIK